MVSVRSLIIRGCFVSLVTDSLLLVSAMETEPGWWVFVYGAHCYRFGGCVAHINMLLSFTVLLESET